MLSQKREKSVFFQKVKKSCSNQFVSLKHTLWTCSECFSCLKPKLYPFWEKWKKHLFCFKKTIIFVAVFDKTQIFGMKNISQTYTTGIPKQFTFIHSSSIYPNFSTKIELLSHFYRKTCFFPVFPPFSHYNSKHNKILGKRGKSVSLEFPYKAACKKLERLNETFSRTQFIFRKGQRIFWKKFFARKGPLPLPNRFLRPTRVHLGQSFTCGASVFAGVSFEVWPGGHWLQGMWHSQKKSTRRVLFSARKL